MTSATPLLHTPTFPPQKAEREAVALQQAEFWAIQLGSACTQKEQAQNGTEEHPSQGAGSAPNSAAKPKSCIGSFIFTRHLHRKKFTLLPTCGFMFLTSCM